MKTWKMTLSEYCEAEGTETGEYIELLLGIYSFEDYMENPPFKKAWKKELKDIKNDIEENYLVLDDGQGYGLKSVRKEHNYEIKEGEELLNIKIVKED